MCPRCWAAPSNKLRPTANRHTAMPFGHPVLPLPPLDPASDPQSAHEHPLLNPVGLDFGGGSAKAALPNREGLRT